MRRRIRLTESTLHSIIKESVRRILNEDGEWRKFRNASKELLKKYGDDRNIRRRKDALDNHAMSHLRKEYGLDDNDSMSIDYGERKGSWLGSPAKIKSRRSTKLYDRGDTGSLEDVIYNDVESDDDDIWSGYGKQSYAYNYDKDGEIDVSDADSESDFYDDEYSEKVRRLRKDLEDFYS